MNFYKKNKHTIRLLIFMVFLLGKTGSTTFAQTTIEGRVTDEETGEEMIGASIVVKKNGNYVQGKSTDFDGNFSITIEPGTYEIEASYLGYQAEKVEGIIARAGETTKVNIKIGIGYGEVIYCDFGFCGYWNPLIDRENLSVEHILDTPIERLPTRNIQDMILITAGTSFQ